MIDGFDYDTTLLELLDQNGLIDLVVYSGMSRSKGQHRKFGTSPCYFLTFDDKDSTTRLSGPRQVFGLRRKLGRDGAVDLLLLCRFRFGQRPLARRGTNKETECAALAKF